MGDSFDAAIVFDFLPLCSRQSFTMNENVRRRWIMDPVMREVFGGTPKPYLLSSWFCKCIIADDLRWAKMVFSFPCLLHGKSTCHLSNCS